VRARRRSASADGSSAARGICPAVDDEFRSELTLLATTGAGEHRLEHAEAEALPARRMHEQCRAPAGHVRTRPGKNTRRSRPRSRASPSSALDQALAERDEHRVVRQQRERPDRHVETLLRSQTRDGEQHARSLRNAVRRVLAPRLGEIVQPVMNRLDLVRRHADALDCESPERLGDRDDAIRRARKAELDVPE
jgi:hypothetical protein